MRQSDGCPLCPCGIWWEWSCVGNWQDMTPIIWRVCRLSPYQSVAKSQPGRETAEGAEFRSCGLRSTPAFAGAWTKMQAMRRAGTWCSGGAVLRPGKTLPISGECLRWGPLDGRNASHCLWFCPARDKNAGNATFGSVWAGARGQSACACGQPVREGSRRARAGSQVCGQPGARGQPGACGQPVRSAVSSPGSCRRLRPARIRFRIEWVAYWL